MTTNVAVGLVTASLMFLIEGCSTLKIVGNAALAAHSCWTVPPNDRAAVYEASAITVRALNVWGTGPGKDDDPEADYQRRLQEQARRLFEDWPSRLGLVATQETRSAPCTLAGRSSVAMYESSKCLAAHFELLFRPEDGFFAAYENSLAVIVPKEWAHLDTESHVIGTDKHSKCKTFADCLLGVGPKRWGLVVRLRHRASGRLVRMFNAHLSHADQQSERIEQATELVAWAKSKAQPGELPPILAGDFNAHDQNSAVWDTLNTCFYDLTKVAADKGCHDGRMPTRDVDAIMIGRKSCFPGSSGGYRLLRFHTAGEVQSEGYGVDTTSGFSWRGRELEPSNHPSPAFTLQLCVDDDCPSLQ